MKTNQEAESNKIQAFRATVRALALKVNKTILSFLQGIFDELTILEPSASEKDLSNGKKNIDVKLNDKSNNVKVVDKFLTFENFQIGLFRIKDFKEKFTSSDLKEVFEDCDDGGEGEDDAPPVGAEQDVAAASRRA
jgi:exosome complex RNA-binding protein Rrp42 (RNase PH superfamily)